MQVLIVEDDPSLMKLLCTAFEKRGHAVTLLTDGTDVVAFARGQFGRTPDAIVLDFHLPKMSGDVVLQELDADPRIQGRIPVIVYSASPACALSTALDHANATFVQKGRLSELFAEIDRIEKSLAAPPHPISGSTTL